MASRKMRRRSSRRKSRKGGEGFGRRTKNPVTGKYEPMTPARSEELKEKAKAEHEANPPTYDAETTARLAAEPDFDDEGKKDVRAELNSPTNGVGAVTGGRRKTRKGKRGSRRR
jgi:hypothetical protein